MPAICRERTGSLGKPVSVTTAYVTVEGQFVQDHLKESAHVMAVDVWLSQPLDNRTMEPSANAAPTHRHAEIPLIQQYVVDNRMN